MTRPSVPPSADVSISRPIALTSRMAPIADAERPVERHSHEGADQRRHHLGRRAAEDRRRRVGADGDREGEQEAADDPGKVSGRVTARKVRKRLAPRLIAARSRLGLRPFSEAMIVSTP